MPHARSLARRRTAAVTALCALLLAGAAAPARAATLEETAALLQPKGVVSLNSSASADVTKDLMSITFNTTKEGADAGTVQSQLKTALDAALAEAKKVAKPGDVEVRTGNFALAPRYVKGVPNGWQGSAELIVEGRDMAAIGKLSGRIVTLTIARVGYALSRELREATEREVSARAIASYRAKAADVAKQFGFGGYALREVNVASSEDSPGPRPMIMQMRAAAAPPADDALPVEPGKGTVTVNVSGTVQLTP